MLTQSEMYVSHQFAPPPPYSSASTHLRNHRTTRAPMLCETWAFGAWSAHVGGRC